MLSVLLTGGMGYIGSHTAVVLLETGHEVVLYDNLPNSSIDVKDKIQEITNKQVSFVERRDRKQHYQNARRSLIKILQVLTLDITLREILNLLLKQSDCQAKILHQKL